MAKFLNTSATTFVRVKRTLCRNAATSHSPGRANCGADSRAERRPGSTTLPTSPFASRAATSPHETRRETITWCHLPRAAARLAALAGPHPRLWDISPSGKSNDDQEEKGYDKLSTSKLAKQLNLTTAALQDKFLTRGLIERVGDQIKLTEAGKTVGGESKYSKKFGPYIIWPKDLRA